MEYFLTITKNGNHGLFKVEPSANSNFKPVKALIELHQKPIQAQSPANTVPQTSIDPLDRLEKLARLLEQGILTQDEFDKKKAEILDL